jgi:hypothetical protein
MLYSLYVSVLHCNLTNQSVVWARICVSKSLLVASQELKKVAQDERGGLS